MRIILLAGLLTTAAAVGFSLAQPRQYEASASLLFRDPALDQKLFGSSLNAPSDSPERAAQTNLELVSLDVVAARTAKRLPRWTTEEVSDAVDVSARGQSDIVSIKARARSPRAASRVANLFAREYVEFRRGADRAKVREAQQLVRLQLRRLRSGGGADASAGGQERGDVIQSLRGRAEDLSVLASLQTGNAELVEPASPPSAAASPKPVRNGVLGVVAGLLLGVAVALAGDKLDRRLRRPEELEEAFGLPVVGRIPASRALKTRTGHSLELPQFEAEAFRLLRANLRYFSVSRDLGSLLVTSAAPQDGKSTVALHLAVAAAESGMRTLLIEADIRHPHLAAELSLPAADGLTTVLSGERPGLFSVRHRLPVRPASRNGANGSGETLDVVLAGRIPPNPSELMESSAMLGLLEDAEAEYELVVIDSAPVSIIADAIPLLPQVGGVLVVSRLGSTSLSAARDLRAQLGRLDAPVLGVVANFDDLPVRRYGYYHVPEGVKVLA
jgi:succinoglycan biosynthesis transport protein ExoP